MVLTTLDTLLTKNQFHFSLDFGSLIASWESRQGLFFQGETSWDTHLTKHFSLSSVENSKLKRFTSDVFQNCNAQKLAWQNWLLSQLRIVVVLQWQTENSTPTIHKWMLKGFPSPLKILIV